MKPWLFLDLDGVVSPLPGDRPLEGYRTWPGAPYQLYVPDQIDTWLLRLDRLYDIVWASSWGDSAHTGVAQPLGLPTWPVLSLDGNQARSLVGAKISAITAAVQADPRPWAWVDDMAHRRLAQRVRHLGLPHILIKPDRHVGITELHVHRLAAFATRYADPGDRIGVERPSA